MTFLQRLFSSTRNLQIHFASKASLIKFNLYIPSPPNFLGRVTLSQETQCVFLSFSEPPHINSS
ncbi:hypothetical protein Hdeb2414_s0018g00520011 [Helianthus debilis subsp. tardiflorus]